MKTVFIAHPLRPLEGETIESNVKKVLAICAAVHCAEMIPVAPYLVSVQYLNDHVDEERELGIKANRECFFRKFIDEIWLYGDRISAGMREEVLLGRQHGIPVVPKTPETQSAFEALIFDERL